MSKREKCSKIIFQKKECPKCGSSYVADIKPENLTLKENIKIHNDNLRHDLETYFVSTEDYRNYYLPYHLNTRCLNCKYEYFSSITKIKRIDAEKKEETDIPENEETKKQSKLKRIFSILKE